MEKVKEADSERDAGEENRGKVSKILGKFARN